MNRCYRVTPHEVPWSSTGGQVAERALFNSDVVQLREVQLQPNIQWPVPQGALSLLTAGSLTVPIGQELAPGDLCWYHSGTDSFEAGSAGASLYCIMPLRDIGNDIPSQSIVSSGIAWEQFDDPAGRPTQPVQILLNGSLSALRTRFDPDYIAGEHWHDFDTLYFISDGRMQFGDEGWFEQGDIRAVHGGHSYGPERPGTDGVEFVLISLGGPVALHWSDLEPPP